MSDTWRTTLVRVTKVPPFNTDTLAGKDCPQVGEIWEAGHNPPSSNWVIAERGRRSGGHMNRKKGYDWEPVTAADLVECEACAAKPGAPTLCQRCLTARQAAGPFWGRTGPDALDVWDRPQ